MSRFFSLLKYRLLFHGVFKPGSDVFDAYLSLNDAIDQKGLSVIGFNTQAITVHSQEYRGACKCNTFIAIYEAMVLAQAL